MKLELKSLSLGALGALLLCSAPAARAQDSNAIGNPQLRDFQLRPQGQQPTPQPQAPAPVAVAPPPVAARPQAAPPAQQPAPPQAQPQQTRPSPAPAAPRQLAPAQVQPQPAQPQAPVAAPENAPPAAGPLTPVAPAPLPPAATPPAEETGPGLPWRFILPAAALALIGLALLLRRRRRAEIGEAVAAEAPALVVAVPEPPAPSPQPVPRPWLELSLKAERASATLTETVVNFELEIANTGKSAARNLRIDVKMFNAGSEQDKEIGAFFRTAGRETTKLSLPGIAAETVGVINGQVAMPREEMRAMVLDDKYLFVPMIAVNALYDWGDGRTGQSSKSYVVGRELQQPSDKMGAFRVDQGPRIWRTVGQRPHNLERRV